MMLKLIFITLHSSSTYEDLFEQQQLELNELNDGTTKKTRVHLKVLRLQQLEQNDGTKSLHQKSGAENTDPVTREPGTRDSKPQNTENWCKQYAAEPRCQTNNYCTANNLCTQSNYF